MSESGAFVTGGGGFVRVRDNASGGFAAELRQQQQAETDRLAKQQAEQDRIAAFRAEEEEKRKALKNADAAKYFREYHNNPKSRGGLGSIYRYTEARFGRCYETDLKQGLAELNSPELLRQHMPEKAADMERRANAKAWAADVKPDYVAKCKFCRILFFTEGELGEHRRDTRHCPRCKSCSRGGDIHICHAPCPHCTGDNVFNCPAFAQFHRIVEDRVPAVKYQEDGEE